MTNKPKAIGTAAEVAVCEFLRRAGYEPERIALAGVLDRGDVHYRRAGRLIVVSVKGGKMAETASPEQIAKWVREVHGQAGRAGVPDVHCGAYVVTKRAGIGGPRAELWRAHYGTAHGQIWSTDLATMAGAM